MRHTAHRGQLALVWILGLLLPVCGPTVSQTRRGTCPRGAHRPVEGTAVIQIIGGILGAEADEEEQDMQTTASPCI